MELAARYIASNTAIVINAVFFEISNKNNFANNEDKNFGSLFLKYKNANPKVMMLAAITPPAQTPVSNGLGVTGFIPGIAGVPDTRISAGNITDTKLIKTMIIEKAKTIHGIGFLVPFSFFGESVLVDSDDFSLFFLARSDIG